MLSETVEIDADRHRHHRFAHYFQRVNNPPSDAHCVAVSELVTHWAGQSVAGSALLCVALHRVARTELALHCAARHTLSLRRPACRASQLNDTHMRSVTQPR